MSVGNLREIDQRLTEIIIKEFQFRMNGDKWKILLQEKRWVVTFTVWFRKDYPISHLNYGEMAKHNIEGCLPLDNFHKVFTPEQIDQIKFAAKEIGGRIYRYQAGVWCP